MDYIHKINNIFLLFYYIDGASEDWMGHFEILMFEDGRYVIKFFMYLTRRTKSLTRTHSHIEHEPWTYSIFLNSDVPWITYRVYPLLLILVLHMPLCIRQGFDTAFRPNQITNEKIQTNRSTSNIS